MKPPRIKRIRLSQFPLWSKLSQRRVPLFFDLEITARCNLNCRHCYINLPAKDPVALGQELSRAEIDRISEEAVSLGAIGCLITGGEPLLRPDFEEIYLGLKRKGLLVSVFTNATLINEDHIRLFKKYPPRDIEVTVLGVTPDTFERISRRKGSFTSFSHGLDRLKDNGIRVRLKTMALRSNLPEIPRIARFCREKTMDYFRFDPFLHLRYDGDAKRDSEIIAERLSPEEIVELEGGDAERFGSLEKTCDRLILDRTSRHSCHHLLYCSAGNYNFNVTPNGMFQLCSALNVPGWAYNLRKGTLSEAWHRFVPKIRDRQSDKKEFLENCRICSLINLCLWCPANAFLETGHPDQPVDYYCRVAKARGKAIKSAVGDRKRRKPKASKGGIP